ncbi:MAG: vitamin K epoxide reductase family protein [Candidatus Paceibacterota bacterium]
MQINLELIISIIFVILGISGFLVAFYIYRKKSEKKKLICPARTDCELVTNSDYSVVGPFRVEVLGLVYYLFITSAYLFVNFYLVWTPFINELFIVISGMSVLFSVYLLFIQSFLIKQWCVWCISSALISILMFLLAFYRLYI